MRHGGERYRADSGSLASFLTQRHRYYTEAPDASIRYANVSHEPWPLTDAVADLDGEMLLRANGFAPPAGDPLLLYSPGVNTIVSPSKTLA